MALPLGVLASGMIAGCIASMTHRQYSGIPRPPDSPRSASVLGGRERDASETEAVLEDLGRSRESERSIILLQRRADYQKRKNGEAGDLMFPSLSPRSLFALSHTCSACSRGWYSLRVCVCVWWLVLYVCVCVCYGDVSRSDQVSSLFPSSL